MDYPKITDVIEAVKGRLSDLQYEDGAPFFAEVRGAVISGWENLFQAIPELTSFPVAVVAAGDINTEHLAAARSVSLVVIVIDEFCFSAEDLSAYDRIDRIAGALSGDVPGQTLKLGGANLLFEAVEPLNVDPSHTAWLVKITAKMSIIM